MELGRVCGAHGIVDGMAHPQFLWLLLSLTSTLAGNLALFGNVANIIVA